MALTASKEIQIRFSEIDSMGVVWHGSYALFFEDAREEFGNRYGLSYDEYYRNGYFAPIVELNISYKRPITYGMKVRVDITYRPTESAKVIFDYEIHAMTDNSLIATAHSIQIFMDRDYHLVWENPEFYMNWKKDKLGWS